MSVVHGVTLGHSVNSDGEFSMLAFLAWPRLRHVLDRWPLPPSWRRRSATHQIAGELQRYADAG